MINILEELSMSKSELIQYLYNEINRQNTWYMWTVGILITLLIAFTGLLGFFQWKLSSKQIENLSLKIQDQLADKYNLDSIHKFIYLEMQNEATLVYLFSDLCRQMKNNFVLRDIASYAFSMERLLIIASTREKISRNEFISVTNTVSSYTSLANKVVENNAIAISQSEWVSFDDSIDLVIKALTDGSLQLEQVESKTLKQQADGLVKLKSNIVKHVQNI
ncbi:hypothetical protein IV64_GL000495 [Lactiplantibacillus xiangfangensis]|uniref:Uncharacterized protein n=2 Tax=Lactiplantibacillus xiangfangensis TaxID=942150 RepID=A0A0R2M378_9LACO|nr:hypothetical protein IV64_GL000495 [Lactiplantibacillus xiangfangensis]